MEKDTDMKQGHYACLLDREGPYFNQLCRRCGLRRSSESKVRYHLCPNPEPEPKEVA